MQSLEQLILLSRYIGSNPLTIDTLLQIRDELLFSLISELTFNKQLLTKTFTSPSQFIDFKDTIKPKEYSIGYRIKS